MPGLHYICDFQKGWQCRETQINRSLESLLHRDDYVLEQLHSSDDSLLACSRYEQYPIQVFDSAEYKIVIEGKIYGKVPSILEQELTDLARSTFSPEVPGSELIDWQLNTDGDFILFLHDKTSHRITILNDALSHLPLYYYTDDNQVIVSREIRFIVQLLAETTFDKIALAQYLLFRYCLQRRTFWRNVYRLLPFSWIQIDPRRRYVKIENLYQYNFDSPRYEQDPFADNAERLVATLSQASRNRDDSSRGLKNVLSLSGGMDSRLVIASLHYCDIDFECATYLDARQQAKADVQLARDVADSLGVDWKLFELPIPKGNDVLTLLRMKNGLNYLEMAFILPFYELLRQAYGPNSTYWTGDIGLSMRGHPIPKWVRNLDDLVRFILSQHARFSLPETAALLGLDPKHIREDLRTVLHYFPECRLEAKYTHFVLFGRGCIWHGEGMDRNRFSFWQAAPMEAVPSFLDAMKCPNEHKKNFRMFPAMIEKLSPAVMTVNDANTGKNISSWKYRTKLSIESDLQHFLSRFPSLIVKLKRLVKQKSPDPSSLTLSCLQQQFNSCPAIQDTFNPDAFRHLLQNPQRHNLANLKILLTLTSAIEDFAESSSSLEQFRHLDF